MLCFFLFSSMKNESKYRINGNGIQKPLIYHTSPKYDDLSVLSSVCVAVRRSAGHHAAESREASLPLPDQWVWSQIQQAAVIWHTTSTPSAGLSINYTQLFCFCFVFFPWNILFSHRFILLTCLFELSQGLYPDSEKI